MTRAKTNTTLAQHATAIRALEKKSIQNVIEIGRHLHEASEKCEHGEFMSWLKSEFSWSDQTALNYRYVYSLTQKPNSLDFARLNITISAVYFVARMLRDDQCPENQAAAKAVIAVAKKDRVTRPIAVAIFEKYVWDHQPEESADSPDEESADSPDEESADSLDEESLDDDDTKSEQPPSKLTILMQEMQGISEHDPAWVNIVADIGTAALQKIILTLQAVYDAHCGISDVQKKADRALARSTSREVH